MRGHGQGNGLVGFVVRAPTPTILRRPLRADLTDRGFSQAEEEIDNTARCTIRRQWRVSYRAARLAARWSAR